MSKFVFSFKEGKPIAIIRGGKHDKKIIHIKEVKRKLTEEFDDDENNNELPYNLDFLDNHPLIKKYPRRDRLEKIRFVRDYIGDLDNKKIITDEGDRLLLKKAKSTALDIASSDFRLPFQEYKSRLEVLPNIKDKKRDVIYNSAPSGAGKSYWCGMFMNNYHRLFPKNNIILFSRKPDDETLDELKCKYKRIILDEEFLNYECEPKDFQDTLCIFDDTDTIKDKEIREEVHNLKLDILETGRSDNVSIIVCSHIMNNYNQTKLVLVEMKCLVIFPARSSKYAMTRTLKLHVGLSPKQIKRIYKLPSRWVCIYLQNEPVRYVVHERGCFMI